MSSRGLVCFTRLYVQPQVKVGVMGPKVLRLISIGPSQTATAGENSGEDETEEVEVTFEEEIPRGELTTLPPLPEYEYNTWLLGLPVICILVLAWNVRWKPGARRHTRRRKKK